MLAALEHCFDEMVNESVPPLPVQSIFVVV